MKLREASYGLSADGGTAFIEMAAISGLPLVPVAERNPMQTTTYGTGELMRDALNRGCTRLLIGLGGSATNDAGMGMLQALGYRFFDQQGREIGKGRALCGKHLSEIASIDTTTAHPLLGEVEVTAACDVHNPFFGTDGAARVFAPQKGANRQMVEQLDAAMQQLSRVIFHTTGKDISAYAGAGAAGGMGGALHAFFGAPLKPGIALLLETLNFAEKIKDAELIITGEGKADRQSTMGKVPWGILQEAKREHIPVILIAGRVEDTDLLAAAGFQTIRSVNPPTLPLSQAMQPETAKANIRKTVEQILKS